MTASLLEDTQIHNLSNLLAGYIYLHHSLSLYLQERFDTSPDRLTDLLASCPSTWQVCDEGSIQRVVDFDAFATSSHRPGFLQDFRLVSPLWPGRRSLNTWSAAQAVKKKKLNTIKTPKQGKLHSPSGNRIQIVMMHPGVLETCPASAQKQNQIAAAMSLLLASRELTPKFGSRPSFPIVCGAEPLHSGPRDICAFKLQAARRHCLYLHPRFELKTPTGIFFLLQFPYNEAESCLPDT